MAYARPRRATRADYARPHARASQPGPAERGRSIRPSKALPGITRVVICGGLNPSPQDLQAFAKAWAEVRRKLAAKGLQRVPQGITLVFTNAQKFYARFWSDDVLCVNLDTTLKKDPVGILVHELGHRVWFSAMGRATRTAWGDDHARQKRARASFATGYAEEAPIEDHAEHFRLDVEGKLTGPARVRYARLGPDAKKIHARLKRTPAGAPANRSRRG